MKALTVVFGLAVAGIAASLGGTIYTAIHESHAQAEQSSHPVAVPAIPGGAPAQQQNTGGGIPQPALPQHQ